jgi:curved DNA-binding protein CbpA
MQDPYLTLDVAHEATDAAIHQAYLEAIRRCPAEQDPQRFQRIRTAYETIRTKKSRLEYALFSTGVPTPLEVLERLVKSDQPGRPDIEAFRNLFRSGKR